MRTLFFVASVALLAVFGLFTLNRLTQPADPFAYTMQSIQAQQAQQNARLAAERAEALEPFQRTLSAAWIVALAAVPFVALFIGIDAYRRRAMPLVRPDHAGQLPVTRVQIESGQLTGAFVAALEQFHRTQQIAASVQPVPHTLTMSPTYSPHYSSKNDHAPQLPAPEIAPPLLPEGMIDLASLTTDWRPSVQSITLAIGPGGTPYRVHARELCHVALAGATGGGKSNIMRLLLAQLLAAGAKVVLADPHFAPFDAESGDDWRPIAQRLHMAPAVKPDEIRHLLAWLATDELPQRLQRRHAGQPVGAPLFLAIDELPSIVKDVNEAPEYMGRLLREARKVNIFIIGAAQDFLVKTIGGAGAVRDCYRTAFYVGGDAQTARVLLDVQGRVDDAQLGQGLAMLRSKATPQAAVVRVPYASNQAIYDLLGEVQPAAKPLQQGMISGPSATAPATEMQPDPNTVATAPEAIATPMTAEKARIVSLFREGKDVAGIVKELWPEAKNGARYQQRSADVQAVLRGVLDAASI